MTEFLIGIVAVIVIVAALFQIALMSDKHTDVLMEARREADAKAFSSFGAETPDFIQSVTDGEDGRSYSRDDERNDSPAVNYLNNVVEYGDPQSLAEHVPQNGITEAANTPSPSAAFGLVRGYDEDSVELLPAVQHLLYDSPTLDVEAEVWMVETTGYF